MKNKKFQIFILFILNLVIDLSILSRYQIFNFTPSITIPLIIVLSMFSEKESIVYYAILQGIFQDLAFGQVVGINALIFYLISYYTFKNVKDNQYSLSYGNICVILSILFKNIFRFISTYIIGKSLYFNSIKDFLMSIILDIAFAMILFALIHIVFVNRDKKRVRDLF